MDVVTRELCEGYSALFVHCGSYYAVQCLDRRGNWSYRPVHDQLSLLRLFDHLRGCYTLGAYVLDREGFCSFAVFDDDRQDGLVRLALLSQELAEQGVSLVLEASRRGGHGWVFFDRPVLARSVRWWLGPYAARWGMELYPAQDRPRPDGFGNLVRLPLGVHRKSGAWYPFMRVGESGSLVEVAETVVGCCAWLIEHVERVCVLREGSEVGGNGARVERGGEKGWGRGGIRAWCQSQDIVEVVGRYTSLDGRGVGRCPLPGHHRRGDLHPSLQVFGGDDPHWYCYTWRRAGNVFDFVQLVNGLTVRETWECLREGAL